MSHMDLSIWPTMGLIIFLAVFAAVTVRALSTKRTHSERMAAMPLSNDSTTPTTAIRAEGSTRGA